MTRRAGPGRGARAAAGLALWLLLAGPAAASFADMTLREMLATSDLVVTGTYTARQVTRDGTLYGVIAVHRVERGADTDTVLLRIPQPGQPLTGADILFRPGQTGLWFLRAVAPGIHAADHPRRYVPQAQAAPLRDALTR